MNYNGKQHLATFLPSVIRHTADVAEIIVADNGSTDDSIIFLQENFPDIRIVALPENYGFAAGYNQALRQVKADYYVILNSDVEVSANWILPVVDLMERDPAIAAAQPKVLAYRQKDQFEYAGAAGGLMDYWGYTFARGRIFDTVEKDNGQYDQVAPVTWASGAALFIKADLYHRFGGFDGDYFAHMEEIDLCWRLRRAGYRIMAQPASTVWHLGGGTLDYDNPRKVFLNFRNLYATLVKNLSVWTLLWLIPLRLLLDGAAAVLFLSKGQLAQIGSIIRAHLAFYGHFFNILNKRKKTAAIVEANRIGPENQEAVVRESVVLGYFIRGKKRLGDYTK